MPRFAVAIEEAVLDVIQVLNNGVRPELEENPIWFVFETTGSGVTKNQEFVSDEDFSIEKYGRVGGGYFFSKLKK